MNNQTTHVTFYFDPVCPWAWRTSLWIREVAQVRPVQVTWDFLSLQAVNKGRETLKDSHFRSEPGFRVMALLRRRFDAAAANTLIDRMYLELGRATHERKEDIGEASVVEAALQALDLPTSLLAEARDDATTLDDLLQSHDAIVERGGFGVPTMVLQLAGQEPCRPAFGPVIDAVPQGEEAGALWDHVAWLIQQPAFFELKRSR